MRQRKLKLSINRNLAVALMLLLILPAIVAGYTYAVAAQPGWFTDEAKTTNEFIAGTVLIDADKLSETYVNNTAITTYVDFPGFFQSRYNIKNAGTKTVYLRAYFEGYWKRINHKNIASASAQIAGSSTRITDSDMAYFYYLNPVPNLYTGYSAPNGFSGNDYSVPQTEITFGDLDLSSSGGSGTSVVSSLCVDDVIPIDEATAGIYSIYWIGSKPNSDPIPPALPFPDGSNERFYFKVNVSGNLSEAATFDSTSNVNIEKYVKNSSGEWIVYSNPETGFSVRITPTGDKKFNFESNYPVYHVYVKGGPGGNLYPYYHPTENPAYPDGVTKGCGLSQPGGSDWSHIVFYYKHPAQVELKKYVFLGLYDNGIKVWQHMNDGSDLQLLAGATPEFKIVVKNIGSTTLENIVVTDNNLDLDPNGTEDYWFIGQLSPGGIAELVIDDTFWWEDQLSTNDVRIELCGNQPLWSPVGAKSLPVYFYYLEKITRDTSVDLCVKLSLTGGEEQYNGSVFVLKSYFEAVQASHPEIMVDVNWPGHPINNSFE